MRTLLMLLLTGSIFNTASAKDSNATNRLNKKYVLNAEIIGANFSAQTQGVEAGYFLAADRILHVKLQKLDSLEDQRNQDVYDEDHREADRVWKDHGNGMALTVSHKQFTGSTFYYEAGAYYRDQKLVIKTEEVRTAYEKWSLTEKDTAEIQDLGVSFTVGNQWHWENLTVGCDWLGLSRSLYKISEKGDASEYYTAVNLLNFNIGYTF